MNSEFKLTQNTVQETLLIPLWGRKICTEKFPKLFPDYEAERITSAIGCDFSDKSLYKMQYAYLNCNVRQYNLSCEINEYLNIHPNACVVELGCGLSTLRSQMNNTRNNWYNLDMQEVIEIREQFIKSTEKEKNISCNLNNIEWFNKIDHSPCDGIIFVAGGLFYYFSYDEVRTLLCNMAEYFKGGAIVFDATNPAGLKLVNKEVEMAGNEVKSLFALKSPKKEMELWSRKIVNVYDCDYMTGYLKTKKGFNLSTRFICFINKFFHMSFMVHAEFLET